MKAVPVFMRFRWKCFCSVKNSSQNKVEFFSSSSERIKLEIICLASASAILFQAGFLEWGRHLSTFVMCLPSRVNLPTRDFSPKHLSLSSDFFHAGQNLTCFFNPPLWETCYIRLSESSEMNSPFSFVQVN